MGKQEGAKSLQEKVDGGKQERPLFKFTVPPRITTDSGIEEVGLVQLTSHEELMATKRARSDTMRLAFELAKQALVEVNGERVGVADGSVDAAWNSFNPKVRMLVMSAYGELHSPEEEDVSAFLKSQRVNVG